MEKTGYILLKKSDRRSGSYCLRVSGTKNQEALEVALLELTDMLRHDFPWELTKALACNLKFTKEWYKNQQKEGLLIPTRNRLVLPSVIEGFKQEKHFKI